MVGPPVQKTVTFRRTDPNVHYRALRLLSETDRWEMGLSPYPDGMRLRMGPAGRPPGVMDFCLGHAGRLHAAVLHAVIERLSGMPEESSARAIDAAFPWAGTRPVATVHLPALLGAPRAPAAAFRVDPRPATGKASHRSR
jgi:hypothetical protein